MPSATRHASGASFTLRPGESITFMAHHLNKLVKVGLLKRIGTSYLMRDACPSCFRRVCHSECHLHMSATDFAPRRETQITTGA